jgi:hypothetical protein
MLSRVMRKWDEDGVPDPDAAALGEFILKVGMQRVEPWPLTRRHWPPFCRPYRMDCRPTSLSPAALASRRVQPTAPPEAHAPTSFSTSPSGSRPPAPDCSAT